MAIFLPCAISKAHPALALFRPTRSWHKTGKEMNAPLRLFSRPTALRLLACAGAAAMLAACGSSPFATAPVDPASPVAAEVASMAKTHGPYPKFSDIPPVPSDQRPVRAFGREADKLETAAAKLERETAPGTWTLDQTAAFAARAQRDAGPAVAVDPASRAATEAFARQIRERATPPPSPRD
jgi:hypothetical protein